MNHQQIIRDTQGRGAVVVCELPAVPLCPVSVYAALVGEDDGYLLESSPGRYSFVGRLEQLHTISAGAADPWNDLPFARPSLDLPAEDLPPFVGGWVGYLGYDLVRGSEHLPRPDVPSGFPDAVLGRADTALVLDHELERAFFVHAVCEGGCPDDELFRRASDAFAPLEQRLADMPLLADPPEPEPCTIVKTLPADDVFCAAVERARDCLARGDIMQVVLSRRLELKCAENIFTTYRRLRRINPSPYLFYLRLGDITLAGSSPEVMVRLIGDEITVLPIAGTRPRGQNRAEDERLAGELLADEKERAEHLMLLDLARNDVGRVAATGSVRVSRREQVKRYSHVMHLVSEVEGRKRPDTSAADVIRACFPAGTVSGAPKVRAMEIIDELEGRCRGPYAGAVGYFSDNGNVDTGIAIRTIFSRAGRTFVQAGAGIVWDSDPRRELAETNHKLGALSRAFGGLS